METELTQLRSAPQWTPQASDFHALQRRVAVMEGQGRRREREWQATVEEARQVHALQSQGRGWVGGGGMVGGGSACAAIAGERVMRDEGEVMVVVVVVVWVWWCGSGAGACAAELMRPGWELQLA